MAETKKKKVHIRTWYDLGDYEDNETNFPPSIVDTYGYESLSDMVARIRRGEVILPQSADEFDYGDEDIDAAFDNTEPLENDLTDLDDARELIEAREQGIRDKACAEAEALMKQRHEEMVKYNEERMAKDRPKVEPMPEAPQESAPEQKKKGWFS